MARRVLVAAAAVAAARPCLASIYPMDVELAQHTAESFIKATPMFALRDAPWWVGGLSAPFVQVSGTVESSEALGAGTPVLRVMHAWSVVPPDLTLLPDRDNFLRCDMSPEAGDFDGFESFVLMGNDAGKVQFKHVFAVNATAWHVTIITNCRGNALQFKGELAYMNPYGYLNGWAFGIMPMNLMLCLLYGPLAVVYVYKTVRNREYVLKVQYAIIAVVLMGFVERLTWFLTYLEMNTSGGRACCPVRADLTFSLALAVFKRSSGALLLLAVCLGFGVVKPALERGTTVRVLLLGLIYTLSSLNLEIEKIEDISSNGRQTDPRYMSSLVVSLCDVIILFWIYFAMSEQLRELREGQQKAKLAMYQQLARALALWCVVWFAFTIMEVMVFQDRLSVPWRYWFLLVSFWDLFFFGILAQICYIWLPSELTAQYAFSTQLPTNEDLDEFDQVGLEMHNPENAADFVIGGEEDHDDIDDDISLDGIELGDAKPKPAAPAGSPNAAEEQASAKVAQA